MILMNTFLVAIAVLARTSCSYLDVIFAGGDHGHTDFGTNVYGRRHSRATNQGVIESMKAIETLIKGTTLMFKGKKGRLFEKKGDYSLAIKDFERVGPRNVYKGDKYWQGRHGYIGDRAITLQKHGSIGRPELYLIKHDETGSGLKWIDTIVYTE